MQSHLLNITTSELLSASDVEFNFNNIMYRQIDSIAIGSTLGPAMANFSDDYCDNKLLDFAKPITL